MATSPILRRYILRRERQLGRGGSKSRVVRRLDPGANVGPHPALRLGLVDADECVVPEFRQRWLPTEGLQVKRNFVKVARMRIEDVHVGDVVNRDPESELDWFEVEEITVLFNGNLQLADRSALQTVSGSYYTIVGVQFVAPADVPEQPPSPLAQAVTDEDSLLDQEADIEDLDAKPTVLETPAALIG